MNLIRLALACLLFAAPLSAHGGGYKGPSDGTTSGGPSAAGLSSATGGGSTGSGAGAPTGLGTTASSGGVSRSSTRGSSGRNTGSAAAAADTSAYLGWEFWWENNRDGYLDLKQRMQQVGHTPGSPGALTARGRPSQSLASTRPSAEWVEQQLIPGLLAVAGSADDRDILDSAVLALARSAPLSARGPVTVALKSLLAHRELSVQAAAALALGVLRDPAAVPLLVHLMRDDSLGRQAVGGGKVPQLVSAFAALALGLIGDPVAVRSLMEAVSSLPDSDRELKICAVAALGLLPAHDPLAATAEAFLVEALADTQLDPVVASYVPTTLGKLGGRSALEPMLKLLGAKDTSNPVLQSVAIGIGRLATLDDRSALTALHAYVDNGRDQQTRHFALMSLAQIGAAGGTGKAAPELPADVAARLRREISGHGSSRTQRGWAALAAAVLGRAHPDLQPALVEVLRDAHSQEHDPSFRGAFALALAMLGDRQSAGAIHQDLLNARQDDLRGHAAEALGLLRHEDAIASLRALCTDAGMPEVVRLKAATGLGLLGDRQAVPLIVAAMAEARSLSALSSQARALGLIGDETAGAVLLSLAGDGSRAPLPRAFAVVALGLLGERDRLPFNAALRADNNYYAPVPAIEEALRIL